MHPAKPMPAPSTALLTAAMAGMLAFAGACGDETQNEEAVRFADADGGAGGEDSGEDAPSDAGDGTTADGGPDSGGEDRDLGDASALPDASPAGDGSGWVDPETKKIGAAENKIYTYSALQTRCEEAGGFVQIHAACAGNNFCAGFSYGDWGEGSELQEHSCAGVNGCNGMSCVYAAEGEGRTGKQVYDELEPPPGAPIGCKGCHTGSTDGLADESKFKVYVLPGQLRPEDAPYVSETQQQSIVAFGKTTFTSDGHALANMAGYWKLLSREEIIAVVQYIREELTPQQVEYRVGDP